MPIGPLLIEYEV